MRRGYTDGVPAPTPLRLFFSFLAVSAVLFLRPPWTNFVFDEQEAILANPYLLGDVAVDQVFAVDFWGRSPERTIGSYRPLPNLLWRSLAFTLTFHTPFFLQLLNVLVHAITATVLSLIALQILKIPVVSGRAFAPQAEERGAVQIAERGAWFVGLFFCCAALSTEAVSGVVGLADQLVGLSCGVALLCLVWAYGDPSPRRFRVLSTLLLLCPLTFFGLLCKETMLVMPVLALSLSALLLLRGESGRLFRAAVPLLNFASSAVGLFGFVYFRRAMFQGAARPQEDIVNALPGRDVTSAFLHWFGQPPVPHDTMNNPLLSEGVRERLASSVSLFFKQGLQALIPWHFSGDYSFPRESIALFSGSVVLGALCFAGLSASVLVYVSSRRAFSRRVFSREARLWAVGAAWVLVTFLPVSGALVLLPTIRADRLFYVPLMGVCLLLGSAVASDQVWLRPRLRMLVIFALLFQAHAARSHALVYSDDLTFWQATRLGAPASAKSHLNYGVMIGARGDLDQRLSSTLVAVRLAPDWPMGRIYLGDTWCRKGELQKARPHYLKGLVGAASSQALTALALQCIWESGAYDSYAADLHRLAEAAPNSWLDYLNYQLSENGEIHQGLPPKYRPRGYNRARPSGDVVSNGLRLQSANPDR